MLDGWDDEQLLAALRESMRARREVPDAFVDMGKSAYAWHNIDAELAQLTYDSSRELAAGLRSETASIRALTFTSARISLEIEVTENSLLGQVIPAAGRNARDADRGGRDHQHPDRRDRLFRGRAHPGQPVPAALPDGGRHRRADRVDHALSAESG